MSPTIATGLSRKRSNVANISGRSLGSISRVSFREGEPFSYEDASNIIRHFVSSRLPLDTAW